MVSLAYMNHHVMYNDNHSHRQDFPVCQAKGLSCLVASDRISQNKLLKSVGRGARPVARAVRPVPVERVAVFVLLEMNYRYVSR